MSVKIDIVKVKPSFFDYDKDLTNSTKRVEKLAPKLGNLAYACGALRVGTDLDNLKRVQDFCFKNGKHEWQRLTISREAIIH